MKRIIMLLLACSLLVGAAAAAGGSGTTASPYIIETAAELQSIQNNLGAYYRLANDIDLSGVTWTPIGSSSAPFTGQLDGNGKTLSNLNLNSQITDTGLFGAIGTGATIKNIIITDFSISTTETRSGIVCGYVVSNSNSVTFDNIRCVSCSLSSSNSNSGIIVGSIDSPTNILNCVVDSVYLKQTNNYNGGVVGVILSQGPYMESCTISNSIFEGLGHIATIGYIYSSASLTANDIIINNCIFLSDNSNGVFVCAIDGTSTLNADNINVNGCSSYTRVSYTGGIVSTMGSSTSGVITNCIVSDCSLIGQGSVGGIVAACSRSGVFIDCTVKDSNLYGTIIYDIGPSGSYDSTSTATGVTNVPNRYLYASGLTATPNGKTVSYALEGQQGSTTIEAAQGTAQSWAWQFGDGQTSTAAQDTTHTYAAPGTYQTSLTLKNYLDTTGITVTTSDYNILPIPPTVSASAQTLQLGQSVTLNAAGTLFSTIQWQYSTNNGASWQDISGATANNYVWTPEAGSYQVRAHVTAVGTGYTAESEVLSISVYAPPTINAVTVSPSVGQYTETITLAAEITDTGTTPTTYQWQQSPQGQNTWTNILGATTSLWVGELTVSGPTDFRLLATGTGGTTTSSTVTYYIAAPGEIQTLSATPSVVTLPGSTTLSATGANVVSWEWQELISGSWQTIGTGATVRESLSAAGTYTYRVQATGADGSLVTSESIEVLAGFPPRVEITSPNDGAKFDSGARIDLSATVTGTDTTWEWAFGSQSVQTGGNGQTTWVVYEIDGAYTISIKAVSLFGTDEDSITIISGRPSRPLASTPTTELDSDGIFVLTDSLTPGQNGQPDIWGFIQGLSKPFTDIIGAWFYLALFAVPYFIIWIRQKNVIIPSILGVMFGAWVLVMLPASALPAAIGILTLAITGGIYGLYVKINNR